MVAAPSFCASKPSPLHSLRHRRRALSSCFIASFLLSPTRRTTLFFRMFVVLLHQARIVVCTHRGDLLSIVTESIATQCLLLAAVSASTLPQLQPQEHDTGHSIGICSSPPDTALFRVFLQHFLDPSFPLDTSRIHILDGHFLSPETHLIRYVTVLLSNPEHNHSSLYTYLLQNPCLTPSEYYQLSFFSSSQTYISSSSYLQGLGADLKREWGWHKPLPSVSRSMEKSLVSISWILLVSCCALNISCLTVLEISDMSCVLNMSPRMI